MLRRKLLMLLPVLLLILCACGKLDTGMQVRGDGSATARMSLHVSQTLIAQAKQLGLLDIDQVLEGFKAQGIAFTRTTQGDNSVFELEQELPDAQLVLELAKRHQQPDAPLLKALGALKLELSDRDGFRHYDVGGEVDLRGALLQAADGLEDALIREGLKRLIPAMEFQLWLTLPGETTGHNAHRTEGGALYWSVGQSAQPIDAHSRVPLSELYPATDPPQSTQQVAPPPQTTPVIDVPDDGTKGPRPPAVVALGAAALAAVCGGAKLLMGKLR